MRYVRTIKQNGKAVVIFQCVFGNEKEVAKYILDYLTNEANDVQEVRLIKLSVDDDIEKVYAAVLNDEFVSGVIIQDWNKDELIKLLTGIMSDAVGTEYLCG